MKPIQFGITTDFRHRERMVEAEIYCTCVPVRAEIPFTSAYLRLLSYFMAGSWRRRRFSYERHQNTSRTVTHPTNYVKSDRFNFCFAHKHPHLV